jgi:hypothetical protein
MEERVGVMQQSGSPSHLKVSEQQIQLTIEHQRLTLGLTLHLVMLNSRVLVALVQSSPTLG